ncbi:MAG: tyrosine-type recombinase/integrase [Solirubrobacteraceae bacterium]
MDRWGWAHLQPWLELRATLPAGALFCVLRGPTRGRPCAPAGIRCQLHHAAQQAGVRRRFAPHQLRHAHAVEMSREGISLIVIQRQLGHADLAITSRYLRGIDNTEIIQAVPDRPEPMIPASRRLAPQRSPTQLLHSVRPRSTRGLTARADRRGGFREEPPGSR